jgi:hypothetical protein
MVDELRLPSNENAAVFNYGRRSKYKGVLGCGVIYDGFPIFVPLR